MYGYPKDITAAITPLLRLRAIKTLTAAGRGQAAILAYHRIAPDTAIKKSHLLNRDILVDPVTFERQLLFLSENYHLVSMDDLRNNQQQQRTFQVALTFDDGYRDNLIWALPILEKYRIPATIYITTRFPEGDSRMWWYELADLCHTRTDIDFVWKRVRYHWDLSTPTTRYRSFAALHKLVLAQSDSERQTLMAQIRKPDPVKTYPDYCLTWHDVHQLSRHPLISIGAHTHSHARLKELSPTKAGEEIQGSKRLLENKIGQTIRHFAYPYGSLNNFSKRDAAIVKASGFDTAVTGQCEHVSSQPDWYWLPRLPVHDADNAFTLEAKFSGVNVIYRAINNLRTFIKGD